jgi:hypothetical protein
MNGVQTPASPSEIRRDMELSNGAEPLDELLAELDATENEWANGGALYGDRGLLNDIRKSLLDATAMELREQILKLNTTGQKVTEAMIEQMAHADENYRQFLDEHVIRKAEWIKLDSQRKKIEMRINRGQAMLRLGARTAG